MERLFRTDDLRRDAFRSPLFGVFAEEVVRFWGQHDQAPYRDVGRPTLWSGKAYATVDFTLERRTDSRRFPAELKREMAWSAYPGSTEPDRRVPRSRIGIYAVVSGRGRVPSGG